uniref:Uncharacterized protein n=1 Tax=Heterorhabditis bacteriophora TaxID=37862 RepID=A0A1I7X109_HETBA
MCWKCLLALYNHFQGCSFHDLPPQFNATSLERLRLVRTVLREGVSTTLRSSASRIFLGFAHIAIFIQLRCGRNLRFEKEFFRMPSVRKVMFTPDVLEFRRDIMCLNVIVQKSIDVDRLLSDLPNIERAAEGWWNLRNLRGRTMELMIRNDHFLCRI